MHSRGKDESATVAMAGAFLEGVLGFSRLLDDYDGDDVSTSLVEFTPVSERVCVDGSGWRYVALDDGGLVIRAWDSGEWRVGKRVCSVECKSRLAEKGRDAAMHGVNVIAQHAAEMIARMAIRMRVEGLEDAWDDEIVNGMDRFVVLLCFAQNLFVIKTAKFSSKYLRHLFCDGGEQEFSSSPPEVEDEDVDMDVSEGSENGRKSGDESEHDVTDASEGDGDSQEGGKVEDDADIETEKENDGYLRSRRLL